MNEEQKKQEFFEAFSVPVSQEEEVKNIGPFKRWQIVITFYIIVSAILELQRLPVDHTHEDEAFTYVIMQLIIIGTVSALIIFGGIVLMINKHKTWVSIMSDILSFILICMGLFITLFNCVFLLVAFMVPEKV